MSKQGKTVTDNLFSSPTKVRKTKRNEDIDIINRVARAYNTTISDIVESIGFERTSYHGFVEQGSMPEVAHQACRRMLEHLEREQSQNTQSKEDPTLYVVQVPDNPDKQEAFTAFMFAMGFDYKSFN